MNYTALYRQFRPQTFHDLVGQEHISKTLLNGILSNKIAHAYLFSGPRGTGKTSTAKIFAKAINCLKPIEGEPCNECNNCIKITTGNSLDVIEIDAASNRGIDEIRDLREKVKYAPAEGKYKVYIVDEVHMLTTEAFNALLKTLEEPPGHIVFVLATTEPHKLPATIISRCQRFDFKRIAFNTLLKQLDKVAKNVGIEVEERALLVVARKADGGMRDALSLLDQSAAYGNGTVTYTTVLDILGGIQEIQIINLLSALIKKDAAVVLETTEYFVAEGKDLKIILHDLQEAVRNTIMVKFTAKKPESVDEEIFKLMLELAQRAESKQLYDLLELLAETENTMKYASQARITFEVGLLRAINTRAINTSNEKDAITKPITKPKEEPRKQAEQKPSTKKVENNIENTEGLQAHWNKILEETKKAKRILHAFLIEGRPVAFSDNIFKIEFDQQKEFHYQQIMLPDNFKVVTNCVNKVLGEATRVQVVIIGDNEEKDNISQTLIDLFGKDKVEFID